MHFLTDFCATGGERLAIASGWICMHTHQTRVAAKCGLILWLFAAALTLAPISIAAAQETQFPPKTSDMPEGSQAREDWVQSMDKHALIALPLAAALGTMLALRPRRKGTPNRSSPVIQTQILLAVIASVVMLVVGSSLARAFGVVGAAGLVRYRSKIDDPKDAGVMLSTLAVGLACGVGVYPLAIFATLFIVAMLYVIESFEPTARKIYEMEVKAKDAGKVQVKVEALLRRRHVKFELREASPDEFSYLVQLPLDLKTDVLSAEVMALDPDTGTAVEFKPEKKKA
jgi:uncharacterized membrane protein YhiD involved in acid resistance